MKLFWKMFLSMIGIITFIFSIFGGWLVYASFHTALDRETNRGINEYQMFLYAFETSLALLPEDCENKEEEIEKIAASIKNNIGRNRHLVTLYDGSRGIIYQDSNIKNSLTPAQIKQGTYAYSIVKADRAHYLEIMSAFKDGSNVYYIDIMTEIQHLYDDRQNMYRQYQIVLSAALIFVGILSYILSSRITRPVVLLSAVTQKMAEGNYGIRAEIKSSGETGALINNFNLMAEKLEENIAKLEDEARKQEDFTASFAHELKTPLTSIVGYSDMLRSMKLSEKEINEYSNYIFLQGKRLEKLSLKLMDMIYLDRQEINAVKINVKKLCASVRNSVLPSLHQKNIKFRMDIEPGYLMGDSDLLLSLFINLIDNARKAISENGEIVLIGRKIKEEYALIVKDNGCGMEEEEVRKITEAFYMIDKSRARKEGGAGLGMSLCKKIVSIHNAKWMIQSALGKGTIVYIMFPAI